MRRAMIIIFLLLLAAAPARAQSPASTQPAGFTLQGHVAVTGALDAPDLARAVVYFESDPALDAAPIPAQSAIVAQKNKAFVPNFVVVPRGTKVEFPNWDHIDHNVFSRSAAAPAFDLDRYAFGQSKSRVFDKIGIVQLFCNIHPFMKALIVVTPNVYFARPDAKGDFKIDNLPAGQYQVSVWQERCSTLHQAVKIGADQTAPVTFTLSEDRDSILENDPPSHGDRWGVDRGLGVKREKLNLPVVTDSHPAPSTQPCPDCN
jgi:plastocyanin